MRRHLPFATASLAVLLFSTSLFAAKIEADPSKEYLLSPQRGPWMIMAATFMSGGVEGRTPDQIASELVLELRKLGLPAYKYSYDASQQNVTVVDRLGRAETRKPLRRVDSVSVIAGNYNDIDDRLAQDTLKWIKRLHPECLQEGILVKPTPGRDSAPLSGAFLTINPMRDPNDLSSQRVDPLLVKLNGGEPNSLFENPGKYTLVVARFEGTKMIGEKQKSFDITSILSSNPNIANISKTDGFGIDAASESARELVTVLRGRYDQRQQGALNNIDAYIWHDRYESVVTVGSFSSENDPNLARYKQMFGPKYVTINGQPTYQPAEHLSVPGFGKKGDEIRIWAFDPNPQLMRVPRHSK